MKYNEIWDRLAAYKGGYGRMLRDETHIKELKLFLGTKNKENDIDDDNLVKFVKILLNKTDRNYQTESSKLFVDLAVKFGGYEALVNLESCGRIDADTLEMFLSYPIQAKGLSKVIKSVSPFEISTQTLRMIAEALNEIEASKITEVWQTLEEKLYKLQGENCAQYALAIHLLQKAGCFIPELFDDIFAVTIDAIADINQIMLNLQQVSNFSLKENARKILQITHTKFVFDLLNEHKITDITPFTNPDTAKWLEKIIGLFEEKKWSLADYLPSILSLKPELMEEVHSSLTGFGDSIGSITKKIDERCKKTLTAIFASPNNAIDIKMAVESIIKANQFNSIVLDMVFDKPEEALARASVLSQFAKEKSVIKPELIALLKKSDTFAQGVADCYKQVMKLTYGREQLLKAIEKSPKFAADTVLVLEKLISHKLHHHQSTIDFITKNLDAMSVFLPAIDHLIKAEKLNKKMLGQLTQCTSNYLAEAKKLTSPPETIAVVVNPGRSNVTVFGNSEGKKKITEATKGTILTP